MSFDKEWPLIRADAGSLFFSVRSLCALLCQNLHTTKNTVAISHLSFAYLELTLMDQLDEALPDHPKLEWALGRR